MTSLLSSSAEYVVSLQEVREYKIFHLASTSSISIRIFSFRRETDDPEVATLLWKASKWRRFVLFQGRIQEGEGGGRNRHAAFRHSK